MDNQNHINLITAYLDDSITPEQRAELNECIDRGEIDILQVKEMETLYHDLDKLPTPEPSENLQNHFYAMLDDAKTETRSTKSVSHIWANWAQIIRGRLTAPQLAFAACLLVIGMLIGNWITPFKDYEGELSALSTEVSQMREVIMMSLLDDQSASERLKAVNISSEIETADDRIVRALLKTLNNDPNVNVRLAAVEALLRHASAPTVREGMVASITMQDSPLVQAALADAMLILQEEQSVDELKKLLDQNDLYPGVRDKLETTIATLS